MTEARDARAAQNARSSELLARAFAGALSELVD
jgi:hypothetical protein